MMRRTNTEDEKVMIEVEDVSEVSPQNQALYDTGKELIGQSLTVGRDYCRFMISTSLSAIPIFLSIIAFGIPDQTTLDTSTKIYLIIPVILFLAASLIFTWGYFPVMESFSLDIIEEIESIRLKTIRKRYVLIRFGVVLFLVAVLTACVIIIATMK